MGLLRVFTRELDCGTHLSRVVSVSMCQCVTSILQRRWPSLGWRLSADISPSPSPSPRSLQVFIRTLALDICRSVLNLYLSPLHWLSPVCDVASGHWKICMLIINSACTGEFNILWLWYLKAEKYLFRYSYLVSSLQRLRTSDDLKKILCNPEPCRYFPPDTAVE